MKITRKQKKSASPGAPVCLIAGLSTSFSAQPENGVSQLSSPALSS
jgi:hypothetical protein